MSSAERSEKVRTGSRRSAYPCMRSATVGTERSKPAYPSMQKASATVVSVAVGPAARPRCPSPSSATVGVRTLPNAGVSKTSATGGWDARAAHIARMPTLEALVSTYIRGELAKRDEGVYTSEPGQWPPGARSRRSARDRIRAVPGHEQLGRGKATVWRVAVGAYRAHHGRRPATPVTDCVRTTDEELAELALTGTRATR